MDREIQVLVGGLGFVGVHLTEILRSNDIVPVILARKSSLTKKRKIVHNIEKKNIKIFIINNKIDKIFRELNPTTIYHVAGKPGGSKKDQYQAHVGLLEGEIEAAKLLGSRIVYFSSIAVSADLANKPAGSIINEDDASPRSPTNPTTIHSETKALGEYLLVSSGLKDWTILRPGLIFGPGAYHLEWKLFKLLISIKLKPYINNVPVVNVIDVAEIAFNSGQGRYPGKWLHLVADTINLEKVVDKMCEIYHKGKCVKIPLEWIIKLGSVSPRTSSLKLFWSIMSKRYKYVSKYLVNYSWRLEPIV